MKRLFNVSHCTIQNNTYGVQCVTYGNPDLQPSNRIRWNSTDGVWGDGSSQPSLGSGTGYNSLYGNGDWDVYSTYGSYIYARGNYWGEWGPYVTGQVQYTPVLTEDPNKVSAGTPPLASHPPTLSGIDTAGLAAYDAAHLTLLKEQGRAAELLPVFQSLVSQYPDKLSGRMALAAVRDIQEMTGGDVLSSLAAVASDKAGTAVAKTAQLFQVGALAKEGKYQEALTVAKALVADGDKLTFKDALFHAGSLAWYNLGDKVTGKEYFKILANQCPADPLAVSGLATIGESAWNTVTKRSGAPAVPEAFDLAQSYPNPFNPSTSIRFALPSDVQVKLTVYDILGREIAYLADGFHQAGYHTVSWNAQNTASGLYLARLTVTNELGRVVYAKTTKLLLTK